MTAKTQLRIKLELVDNVREHTVKAVGLNTRTDVNENGSFQVKSLLFSSSIVSVRFSRQLLLLSRLPFHCGNGHSDL